MRASLGAFGAALSSALLIVGCGGGSSNQKARGTGGASSGSGGSSSGTGSTSSANGGSTLIDPPGQGGPNVGTQVGQLDTAPSTSLPSLPSLTNVVATERDDSVGIDFDPVDGATDYRVYPLPSDGDVKVNADGSVTVKNAIYRCGGLRQTYDVANNLTSNGGVTPQSADGTGVFTYDGNGYAWKTQIPAKPTLGYVYVTPAADRVPVYVLAGYSLENEVGWAESRLKIYTTDATERKTLFGQGWRDDGIAFYVPAAASGSTTTVYRSQTAVPQAGKTNTQHSQYYFLDAERSSHASDTTPPAPAFQVLTAAATDTQPLMAVMYDAEERHVELAVGKERFNRASNQGADANWHVEWSGISKPTTLVVEALASGCPYQGFSSPQHLAAPPHQTFYTVDELQKASATGEVFINGQFTGPGSPPVLPGPESLPKNGIASFLTTTTMSPKALARSFVAVAPAPHAAADWDWYQGFGTDFGAATPVPRSGAACGPNAQPGLCGRWQTDAFDFGAYNTDGSSAPIFTYGTELGQLWEAFDDLAGDVTGKVRFTARQNATIDTDPNKFLHATMSVDIVTTSRRYPQLIISDQSAPVQDGFANPDGNTLLFQGIGRVPTRIELQAIHGLVNGRQWDVNNQAPEHVLVQPDFSSNSDSVIASDPAMDSHSGVDRMTRFDVYVSSNRVYFFLDGIPTACTQYPSALELGGSVTVSFGDVLYHEAADDEGVCSTQKPYPFLHARQCTETKRHFDDLGFKSGVPGPAWDETIHPCGAY